MTFSRPLGKIATSPASSRSGGIEPSVSATQHDPEITAWNEMTCSASGIIVAAIVAVDGDSPTQGVPASTSKNSAPVRRTARNTSERTSMAAHRTCSSASIIQQAILPHNSHGPERSY
jgi:hypothetical protein